VEAAVEVALIWAQARDGAGRPVIGVRGDIPWRVPEDFKHFQAHTRGHPIVMGMGTWLSLPKRPLPDRTNIVLSDVPGWADSDEAAGAIVVGSLAEALAVAAPGGETTWIVGGGQVYAQAMAAGLATRLEVTEIDLVVDGDTFAPPVDPTAWQATATTDWRTSAGEQALRYRFITYRPTQLGG